MPFEFSTSCCFKHQDHGQDDLVAFNVLRFRGNVRAISNVIQLLVPILVKTEVDKGHNSLIW